MEHKSVRQIIFFKCICKEFY